MDSYTLEHDNLLFSPAAPEDLPHISPQPSILAEYLFFPFYDWIVRFFPTWWVPNKVTLFGVACTLLSSFLLLSAMGVDAVFVPGYASLLPASLGAAPDYIPPLYRERLQPFFPSLFTWECLLKVCGLLNLIYCVADNTDGRLARRDGRSSTIGEYLDHGLDCVTSLLSACLVFPVMGGSMANMAIAVCLIAYVTVLSHTLHFERRIFLWGNRIATVDEAMILFGVAMWVPLIFPNMATTLLPLPQALTAMLSPAWAARAARVKVIDAIYAFYCTTQVETILSVSRRNWAMMCRLHVWFMILNSAFLLAMIGVHQPQAEAALATGEGLGRFTFGPFSYPALWIVTCAFSASTIVHIPIAARCARAAYPNVLPLAGVVLVWMTFLSCPSAAAGVAIVVHVVQILHNLRHIQEVRG